MLAAFCSLISNNVLPVNFFVPVLRRLLSQQQNFGGIIKSTLDELRNTDKGLCGRVMVEALAEAVGNLQVGVRDFYTFVLQGSKEIYCVSQSFFLFYSEHFCQGGGQSQWGVFKGAGSCQEVGSQSRS